MLRLIQAAMVADGGDGGSGCCAAPGAILVNGDRIIACGSPESIGAVEHAVVERRHDRVLIPALVNVHAHLDLTAIGPVPYTGDFLSWVDLVRTQRKTAEQEIRASVQRGAELARAGGTALIGDIAGARSLAAVEALRETGLAGISFLEVFGQGKSQTAAASFMRSLVEQCELNANGVQLGIQPHAPYSCGRGMYEAAIDLGLPLATHLAETLEEIEFTHTGGGPFAELLRQVEVWDETITGTGQHPVDALALLLARAPWIAAHLNYVSSEQIERLARLPITVAYCPRASSYFQHPQAGHPPHRYREMLEKGVNVALGTDSLLCLDTRDRISVLDEMRLLHQRDGTDARLLLRMATINGARALGCDPTRVTLSPGPTLGVLGLPVDPNSHVDPFTQALHDVSPPEWIVGPFSMRGRVAGAGAGGYEVAR